jgi:hypothetical protein
MAVTLMTAVATLAVWVLLHWWRVTAVRFQWSGSGTSWRVTVAVAHGRTHTAVAAPLWVPSPGPHPKHPHGASHGPPVLGALEAAGAILSSRSADGRLWTRGSIALGDAALSAVAAGATGAALGVWYAWRLVPLRVRYLRVAWASSAAVADWELRGRIGGIFRFRTGDIILALAIGVWHLARPAPRKGDAPHGAR